MDERLLKGESFSGHEKNCLYLNPRGSGAWANASHVSGFDFPDDARAVAVTDWDLDGDVDVWVTNRTAPRVRFLRNDFPRAGRGLLLDLRATKGARQAIGARVTIQLAGKPAEPLVKELRAGEGFLAQSSKRLHFGIPAGAQINNLTVRWRRGSTEEFTADFSGSHYLLVEGSGKPVAQTLSPAKLVLQPAAVDLPSETFARAVALPFPTPLPPLRWTDFQGKSHAVDTKERLLLAIWPGDADGPTTAQLLQDLAKLPVKVLALADQASAEARDTASRSQGLETGYLTSEMMARLEFLGSLCFEIHLPLRAPQAFLLENGLLKAVYRDFPKTLLEDAAQMPFPGQWHLEPKLFQPLGMANFLLATQNHPADATDFLRDNRESFRRSRRYPGHARDLALRWFADKNFPEAAEFFREAYLYGHADAATADYLAQSLLQSPKRTPDQTKDALLYAMRAAELDAQYTKTLEAARAAQP
jgi:hypothetical protein